MRLRGKVALITGGSKGIGEATAALFIKEGAFVYFTGRHPFEVEDTKRRLGDNACGLLADATEGEDVDQVYRRIKAEQGRLDVLFTNVGGVAHASLGEITSELYQSIFNTNVWATVLAVQGALPLMSTGASIVLNAGILGNKGWPAVSMMAASKAAVRSLARSWAADLRGSNIRVNAVSPGPTDTPGLRSSIGSGDQADQMLNFFTQQIPLERMGQPADVANAALFLASDESSFMTGSEICVDGGMAQV